MTSYKKLLSRKKPAEVSESVKDSQTKTKKKNSSPGKISLFNRNSKVEVTVAPVPEIVSSVSEPVNEKVLETYSLIEPYCRASIVKDLDRGNIKYVVEEPKLTTEDEVQLKRLKEILNQVITLKPSDLQSKEAAGKYLIAKSKEIFNDYDFQIDEATQDRLIYCIVRDNLGFGKIDSLMHDQ